MPIFQMPSANVTLYAVWKQQVQVTVKSTAGYTLGSSATFYVSKNTAITQTHLQSYKPSDTPTRKFTWKANSPNVDSDTRTTIEVDIDSYLDVENAFNVNITLDGSSIGNVPNKFNGDNITSDAQALLTNNNEANNKRYAWNTGTVTVTGQTVEIKTYCTVTAVQLTLSSDAITNDGSSPGYYKADFTGKDSPAWYNVGASFPTPTIKDINMVDTTNVRFDGEWEGESASDYYTEVDEEAAGKTLKAFVYVKQAYLRVQHFNISGSTYRELNGSSELYITELDLPETIPFGTTISSSGNGSAENVITITISGQTGDTYQFSSNLDSVTSGGCYITTTTDGNTWNPKPNFPNDGSEDDITSYTVGTDIDDYGDIYLGIYWHGSI